MDPCSERKNFVGTTYGEGLFQSWTIDFSKMDQNLVNISSIWKSKGLWHIQRVGPGGCYVRLIIYLIVYFFYFSKYFGQNFKFVSKLGTVVTHSRQHVSIKLRVGQGLWREIRAPNVLFLLLPSLQNSAL